MSLIEIPFHECAHRSSNARVSLETKVRTGAFWVMGLKTDHPEDQILSLKLGGTPELLAHRSDRKPARRRIEGSAVRLHVWAVMLDPNIAYLELAVERGAPVPKVWLLCSNQRPDLDDRFQLPVDDDPQDVSPED